MSTRSRRRAAHPDEPPQHPSAELPEPVDLRGSFDGVEPNGRAFGWCWSPDEPLVRRAVKILLDGQEAAAVIADILRDDLLAAGIGDGGHGFVADIPPERRGQGGATATLLDAATDRRIGAELRVAWTDPTPPPLPLAGNVDQITRDGWVSGWCWDPADPQRRLLVDVLVDDQVAGSAQAAEARADLRHAEVGDGCYGFNFMVPYDTLADRGTLRIRVVEHGTGRPLGEPASLRIGRRAESESRLLELERQLALMHRRLDLVSRGVERQPDTEARAARAMFATVAGFFQDLADGLAPASLVEGPRGGVASALAELRRSLPDLALRHATPDADGRPLATIAVPATASVEEVHGCLKALREADIDLAADIVLLDPSGHDPRCALLPALVANLRVGPAAGNPVAGFARLLREADTELVGMVSPTVRPVHGWLAAMIATLRDQAADDAPAGLICGVVIRADGLLQQAGLVLDADRRFRDLGHLAPADLPEHCFLRPVDAVAPLLLLADRAHVAAAGGLDDAYHGLAPAVADLCLALRASGFPVLRQPAAQAFWNGSGELDPTLALAEPEASGEGGRRLRLAVLRHGGGGGRTQGFVGHALVVDAELPEPDRDAGSVAALQQMLVLRRLGWRVTFAAAGGAMAAASDRRRLEALGVEVADAAGHGVSDTLRERGADLQLVHLYRHRTAALLLPLVRQLAPGARILFSPADLHYLREERELKLRGSAAEDQVAVTRAQELRCVREADATILLSDHEHALLAAEVDPSKLHLLRWIARPVTDAPPFEAREGLLFVGNFRHAPNLDAVLWFAAEVAPILARLRPGLRLDVVGADAPPALRALHGEAIRVRGWIPELAPLLDSVRLTVAPLRYGAGFKGKVATSLAAGVPVIGTAIAFEGTGLGDGDGVVVADDAEACARSIARVHDDAGEWTKLSERARERVAALYSPRAADAVFRTLLSGLGLPTN